MNTIIHAFHWTAAVLVLMEALNKLERTNIREKELTRRVRAGRILRALGWGLMALGAGGALITPLANIPYQPSFQDACIMVGFAVLIARGRIKDPVQSDDSFTKTTMFSQVRSR